ncbi:PPR containing plant-like protein [Medicago truncatula]|uniref:PPR containing plant-like protein n=1 Tax=Medicago truncatula TaxID=3880 RepID=G7KSZ6_MEDTR|nr:PPR containing plant-like protein [Medicago truncatula]
MNRLQEARDLFQDIKRRGIKPKVVTYTVLLHGRLKQAYLKMHSSPEEIKGNDATYNDSTILRDMEEMKVSPNVDIYTVLIDGHIKIYNFEKAVRFFNEIIDQGLKPDRVTYTALIWGLLNGRQKEIAIIYYDEMSSKGMTKPLLIPSGDKKFEREDNHR